ncbi:hypothetical protein AQUCO_01700529v1 [Aquilegia coerulea]|uniref:Uncharacterized protein n=1 Tax=Aquilegia coerulea TaxID=218851 RepID=A0A2G5DP73_AQUCA|nr:hypothetical protein AQUCO_01700529v1 [Aquilegia coerulea]
MAGMLPGVELARIRRISHHSNSRKPRESSLMHQFVEPSSDMGETALIAKRKLDEILGLNSPSRYGKVAATGDNPKSKNETTKWESENYSSKSQKKLGKKARVNCINDNEEKQSTSTTILNSPSSCKNRSLGLFMSCFKFCSN